MTKYKFVIDYKFLYVILAAVLYIMLVRRIEVQFESAIHMRIISILLTIICVLYVIMNSMSLNTETWEKKGTYPDGSVVYQQYINDDPTSIVSNLKNIGYTTVAMHPYYATGWSRNKVYPHLGYDETYFIDDFDQTKILREYITDQEL